MDGRVVFVVHVRVKLFLSLRDDAGKVSKISNGMAIFLLPLVASQTGSGDEQGAKLASEVVFIRLEVPAKLLDCWRDELANEFLETFGDLLIVREDDANVAQRGNDL